MVIVSNNSNFVLLNKPLLCMEYFSIMTFRLNLNQQDNCESKHQFQTNDCKTGKKEER